MHVNYSAAHERVKELMLKQEWVSTMEINDVKVGGSEGTRRLRELKEFGYDYEKRHIKGSNQFEYRLVRGVRKTTTNKNGALHMSTATQATAREAREFLLSQEVLPEGVTVGNRGRLSQAAKDYFADQTGRQVVSPVTSDSAE